MGGASHGEAVYTEQPFPPDSRTWLCWGSLAGFLPQEAGQPDIANRMILPLGV